MTNFLSSLFGRQPKTNYTELIKQGAVIIDVRTKGEFQSGHIEGAINIPLDTLLNNFSKLKKDKCIICCCASGMRSGSAKNILKSNGFNKVHNGGSWMDLQNKIN